MRIATEEPNRPLGGLRDSVHLGTEAETAAS